MPRTVPAWCDVNWATARALSQGAIGTAQGIGASLSPLLGGWVAQDFGYPAAFLSLGALSLGAVALWIACGPMLRRACA